MKIGFENKQSSIKEFGSLNIFYDAGAKIETPGYRGVSHLAEHLISKAIEQYEEQFDAHGINQNALTSENYVLFYFNGLNENLKKFEDIFIKLLSYVPTKEEFEKEKRVVLTEYDQTFNEKRSLILNLMRKYYNTYSAIGLREDVEKISYEDYLEFQKAHFSHPTYILRVGETDFFDFYTNLTYVTDTECSYELKEYDYFQESKIKLNNMFFVKWLDLDYDFKDITLLEYYLSYGLTSPMYSVLREKLGLVYYVSADDIKLGDRKLFIIMCESDPKNEKKIDKSLRVLIENLPNELSESRFENMKKTLESTIVKQNLLNWNVEFAKNASSENFYTDEYFKEMTFEKFKELVLDFSKKYVNAKTATLSKKEII